MIENNLKNRKLTDFTELKYEYFHSLFSRIFLKSTIQEESVTQSV